ncbi:MAG: Flp pilus assembly protein CpaB [Firmicutes bacterium]|nr:Flp pilus assembly protein CpaB [Bacillota bacterium]
MAGRWRVVGSIVLALAAAATVYFYLEGLGRRYPVVVAAAAVPAGKVLAPGDLRVVMLPGDAIHPQAVRSLQDGLGRVTSADLVPGEQVLQSRTRPPDQAGPGADLPPHLRAMLLPVPVERWAGGALRPGSLVDVVFVSDDPEQPDLARVLIPAVRVLGVRDERGLPWAQGKNLPLGVLVAVTAEEAERLAFALEHGSLYLVLCPFEPVVVATSGANWDNLFFTARGPSLGESPSGEGSR